MPMPSCAVDDCTPWEATTADEVLSARPLQARKKEKRRKTRVSRSTEGAILKTRAGRSYAGASRPKSAGRLKIKQRRGRGKGGFWDTKRGREPLNRHQETGTEEGGKCGSCEQPGGRSEVMSRVKKGSGEG